eukprot:c31458_g1_i1 orf=115-324(+)
MRNWVSSWDCEGFDVGQDLAFLPFCFSTVHCGSCIHSVILIVMNTIVVVLIVQALVAGVLEVSGFLIDM